MVQYSQGAPDRGHYTKGNKVGFYICTYTLAPGIQKCTKHIHVYSTRRVYKKWIKRADKRRRRDVWQEQ